MGRVNNSRHFINANLISVFQEHLNHPPNDPEVDKDIINSIEDAYFNDDKFDTDEYELQASFIIQ